MSTTLTAWRTDLATVVTSEVGITCQAGPTGNPEPNTAIILWGDPWLSFEDGATFCAPLVSAAVVLVTSSSDLGQAVADLDAFLPLLTGAAGSALAGGGRFPPVLSVSAPSTLFEDSNLLAARADLRPVAVTLT